MNSRERRKRLEGQDANVFWEMTGRMSAAGTLGKHKYEEPTKQDWTYRTYYVADDIMPPQQVEKLKCKKEVDLLELKAMNDIKGKLRPTLHKALHKHNPWDFKMPRDLKKEKALAKSIERENRLKTFGKEMDTIVL